MSKGRNPSIFAVKNEAGLEALPAWLQSRAYDSWHTGFKDRFGNQLVGLGKRTSDTQPFNDIERRGLVVIGKAELRGKIIDIVKDNSL